ncbi:MAG: hypothetical protein ACOH5I_22920 [Oligoflexus sp.]
MHLLAELQQKLEQAQKVAPEQRPVVIFDLDDTLIDCRHRKLQVCELPRPLKGAGLPILSGFRRFSLLF